VTEPEPEPQPTDDEGEASPPPEDDLWERMRAAFRRSTGAPEPAPAPPPAPPAPPLPPWLPGPVNGQRRNWAVSALTRECLAVASHPPGGRNVQLNSSAFSLGQIIGSGDLDRTEVSAELATAAAACGLTADDGVYAVTATINSGLSAGILEPRVKPDPPIPPIPGVTPWLSPWPAGSPATTGNAGSSTNGAAHPPPSSGPAGAAEESDPPPAAPTAEQLRAIWVRATLPCLDWPALWADESEEEWIIEPILPARRLVALYSAPKVGKSLLMLELAAAVATGRPALGCPTPDRARVVLYVDFENDPRADVRARLQAFGYQPAELDKLCYLSFPTLAALDSEQGSQMLLAAVAVYEAEVVVIDTVSRSVAGE
jgi:hypothetical protein